MFAEWEKKSDSLAGRRIWLVFVLTNQVGQSLGLLFLLAEISGQAVNETDRQTWFVVPVLSVIHETDMDKEKYASKS